jgi:uncharacterized protein (TIGR00730 family)
MGSKPVYQQAARALMAVLYQEGITLVTGGSNVGIMGVVVDEMLALGGRSVGVMSKDLINLKEELTHPRLTELHVTDSLSTRKEKIEALSDGFILFPGGPGSFDEFFQVYASAKLHLHTKPIAIFNVDGFYNNLLAMMDHMALSGFMHAAHRDMVCVSDDPATLLSKMKSYQAEKVSCWI